MFFFFSSTNTLERIERLEIRNANNEIAIQCNIAKNSTTTRRNMAEIEISNIMNKHRLDHAGGHGVSVERINNQIVFNY